MPTEKYVKPEGEAIQRAIEFTCAGIAGAEAYSFLSVNKNNVPEGVIWLREERENPISVIYNNGDMTVIKENGKSPYPGRVIMKYNGTSPSVSMPAAPLSLADTLDVYRMLGGGKLSPANEKRYVYRARLMRDGFSRGFGIKKEGLLASFAFVAAENTDSCLIGDVFTLPEYRGRGYAKTCVLTAVQSCLNKTKSAYILCDREMTDFYRRMGFAVSDAE